MPSDPSKPQGLTNGTRQLVQCRWKWFCEAVHQAEVEHGSRLEIFVGEGEQVIDKGRWEAGAGGSEYRNGGAIVISLHTPKGVSVDGGGW